MRTFKDLFQDFRFKVSFIILCILLVYACLSFFSPYDPTLWHEVPRDMPPSREYFLGTDSRGIDIFWMASYAVRNSIVVALIAGIISRLIAVPVTRIRAHAAHPGTPVFRLEGGPGLTNMRFPHASRYAGARDVVLVGYRGVGTDITAEYEAKRRLTETLDELQRANRALQHQNGRLREQEREISKQASQMAATLDNMRQGLIMLDADFRLVVWNSRFTELLGVPPGKLRAGGTSRDLFRVAFDLGHFVGQSFEPTYERWLRRLTRREGSVHKQLLADHRLLSVTYVPMADTGWVITYEDITECERAEAALRSVARRHGHDVLVEAAGYYGDEAVQAVSRLRTDPLDLYPDPLPVDVAIREGADVILAMGFESPYPRRIRSATRYAFQVNSIYTNNLLRANYAFHNLAHHAEIIPVLPNFARPIRLFDTHEIPYVIEEGERATVAQLDHLHQALEIVRA